MDLKTFNLDITMEVIDLEGEEVGVKQYLPSLEKFDLIGSAIKNSITNFGIDFPKAEVLFNAFILIHYTDLDIEIISEEYLCHLYDYFEMNGYMDKVIAAIPNVEYDSLVELFERSIRDMNNFQNSAIGVVKLLAELVPELMEELKGISGEINSENFDIIKYIHSKFQ